MKGNKQQDRVVLAVISAQTHRRVLVGSIRSFRDLIAWQRAVALTRMIYKATRGMPAQEQFGLTNQMRRAAVSVPSNIAEGFGRQSRADYIKFLRTARGSLMELDTQYELATSMDMIVREQAITELLRETDRVLQGLIRGLENKGAG